jgi:hypothetical protein
MLRIDIACIPGISYHIAADREGSLLMFRLRQKHSRYVYEESAPVNADRLIAAQSVRAAITAAAIAIIAFNIVWAYTASASGKYFPWVAVVQGAAIGMAVQRIGRGLDWRFPLIAGVAAWTGAFTGNLFIALEFTASETGRVSGDWWQIVNNFLVHTVTVVDVIYAFSAVAVATYYSKRRLNRHQVFALRKHAEE